MLNICVFFLNLTNFIVQTFENCLELSWTYVSHDDIIMLVEHNDWCWLGEVVGLIETGCNAL